MGRPPPAPGVAPDRAGLMNLPVDLRDRNSVVLPYFCVSVNLPARFWCGTIGRPNAIKEFISDVCGAVWPECPCVAMCVGDV